MHKEAESQESSRHKFQQTMLQLVKREIERNKPVISPWAYSDSLSILNNNTYFFSFFLHHVALTFVHYTPAKMNASQKLVQYDVMKMWGGQPVSESDDIVTNKLKFMVQHRKKHCQTSQWDCVRGSFVRFPWWIWFCAHTYEPTSKHEQDKLCCFKWVTTQAA